MEKQGARCPKVGKPHLTTTLMLTLVWIVIVILLSFLSPFFFKWNNFLSIAQYSVISGITAIGMTVIIIVGCTDISVGSIITLVTMVQASMMPESGGVLSMVLVALAIGFLCGVINGLLVTKLKIAPFIATFGTQQIFRGLAYLMTGGVNKPFNNKAFSFIGRGTLFGNFPFSFLIMVALGLILTFILVCTPLGKKFYCVGANPLASRLMGINPQQIRLIAYIICGVMAGIAGLVTTSLNSAGLTSAGLRAETNAIASAVMGGASMAGGSGSIAGTVVGVLLINSVTNGLNLMGISSYWQIVAQGALFIIAIVIDALKRKK